MFFGTKCYSPLHCQFARTDDTTTCSCKWKKWITFCFVIFFFLVKFLSYFFFVFIESLYAAVLRWFIIYLFIHFFSLLIFIYKFRFCRFFLVIFIFGKMLFLSLRVIVVKKDSWNYDIIVLAGNNLMKVRLGYGLSDI